MDQVIGMKVVQPAKLQGRFFPFGFRRFQLKRHIKFSENAFEVIAIDPYRNSRCQRKASSCSSAEIAKDRDWNEIFIRIRDPIPGGLNRKINPQMTVLS